MDTVRACRAEKPRWSTRLAFAFCGVLGLMSASCGSGKSGTASLTGTASGVDASMLTASVQPAPSDEYSGVVVTDLVLSCPEANADHVPRKNLRGLTLQMSERIGGRNSASVAIGKYEVSGTATLVAQAIIFQAGEDCAVSRRAQATGGTVDVSSWAPFSATLELDFGAQHVSGIITSGLQCGREPPQAGCE